MRYKNNIIYTNKTQYKIQYIRQSYRDKNIK